MNALARRNWPGTRLVACHECDALYRRRPLARGQAARCARCGARLYRAAPFTVPELLALVMAAMIVFLIANGFPIITLEMQGSRSASTLLGAVVTTWREGRPVIASLVLATTVLFPWLELSAMLYLLAFLVFGQRPPGFVRVLAVVQALRPWGMIEVFMLGIVVAIVKLSMSFTVVPGPALWAFGTLTLLLAAVVSYDPHHLWELGDQAA